MGMGMIIRMKTYILMTNNLDEITALMQLASPALPIGGFSYSQGLEAAIDIGIVNNQQSALSWIKTNLLSVFSKSDARLWSLSYAALEKKDLKTLKEINDFCLANRESSEFRAESEQMGWSLLQIAKTQGWGIEFISELSSFKPLSLMTAHSFCAYHLNIQRSNGLAAFAFSWLENQVAAAIKTIPLGQVAGQQLLSELRKEIPAVIDDVELTQSEGLASIDNFSPMLAILSSRHETQYSRLFRS